MKISGTKSYIQIEDENGNIARFVGESCFGEFYAYASPVQWVRHRGRVTDEDRMDLIYRATRYGKENGTRILFFDDDRSVMFGKRQIFLRISRSSSFAYNCSR